MCTLTVVPNKEMLIITSNRDEHVSRGIAKFPVHRPSASGALTFPQDPLAGGTWIASSPTAVTVLLNGGLEKHAHQPPYRKSRGMVVIERFDFREFHRFAHEYDLTEIEPFTMVNIHLGTHQIEDLVWTGTEKIHRNYPHHTPLIWSSTTLYSPKIRANRKKWFSEWVTKKHGSSEDMQAFHEFNHGDQTNGILMDRHNGLKTVSISQIISTPATQTFRHTNLLDATNDEIILGE